MIRTLQRQSLLRNVTGLLVAAILVLATAAGARAMNIGYYEMCNDAGLANQAPPITAAGHTPVQVFDLTPVELAGLDALFVDNCSNDDYGAEYLAHLADVESAVDAGLVLVMHDRRVEEAETVLPGGAAFDIRRHVEDDGQRQVDVFDDTTPLTQGPGGTITDTNLDNGGSSNHGFTVGGSVPGDARIILTRDDPTRLVTFAYGFGQGAVVYSTIPLDHYLNNPGANIGPVVVNIYAVNAAAYAASLANVRCGNGAIDAGEQCDLGAGNNGVTCCAFDCSLRGAGVTCRDSDGACDPAEVCDGSSSACPADVLAPASTVCRPAADDCDLAESCTGTDAACPTDAVKPDADGDTVCDFLDNCDTTPNVDQADADLDDAGDACDLCTAVSPALQTKGTKIVVGKQNTPPGDDKLAIVGNFVLATLPPLGALVTTGVRFVVDEVGGQVVDVTIPGGAFDKNTKVGWKVNTAGTAATYVNASASPIQGITSVSVRKSKRPGQVKFTIRGKKSAYPVSVGQTPLNVTLVLDPPLAETGQCVASAFLPSACKFSVSGATVTCK